VSESFTSAEIHQAIAEIHDADADADADADGE